MNDRTLVSNHPPVDNNMITAPAKNAIERREIRPVNRQLLLLTVTRNYRNCCGARWPDGLQQQLFHPP